MNSDKYQVNNIDIKKTEKEWRMCSCCYGNGGFGDHICPVCDGSGIVLRDKVL